MGYYGMIQPHLKRRDELAHGRTKGSRNGVSNTPGYNAIGKKAIGRRLPDGTYVYDDPTMMQKSMDARMQNMQNAQNMQNMQRGLGNIPGPAQQQRQQAANILKNVTSRQAQQNLNPLQRAGQAMSGWANQAGQTINGWAGGLADKAKSAAGTVGEWLGDRWNNLGEAANKWAGGLPDTAKRAAGRVKAVGTNVGNWLGERAGDVRNAAGRAGEAIGGAANQAGQWLGARAGDVRNAAGQAGQWLGDRGREAWDAYSNSPLGELDRKAVGAVKNAGQAIGRAAGRAGEAIGNAAGQAGQWIGERANDVRKAADAAGEFITGNRHRNAMNTARSAYENTVNKQNMYSRMNPSQNPEAAKELWDRMRQNYTQNQKNMQVGQSRVNALENAYNTQTLPGILGTAAGKAGRAIGDTAGKVGRGIRDLPGNAMNLAGKAGEAIGGAANAAGRAIGGFAERAGEAMGDAGHAVGNFAYDVAGNRSYEELNRRYGAAESAMNNLAMKEQALDAVRGTDREAAALEEYRKANKDYERALREYEHLAETIDQPNLYDATNFIGTMFNGNKKKKK